MNDRELLELSAKAAGMKGYIHEWINGPEWIIPGEIPITWNPLQNDGDAFRLAMTLGIEIFPDLQVGEVSTAFAWTNKEGRMLGSNTMEEVNDHQGDLMSAARWAIVIAAAEIGRAK